MCVAQGRGQGECVCVGACIGGDKGISKCWREWIAEEFRVLDLVVRELIVN